MKWIASFFVSIGIAVASLFGGHITTPITANNSSNLAEGHQYSIPQCSLTVTVKNGLPINIGSTTDTGMYYIDVGNNAQSPILTAACQKKSLYPSSMSVQDILGINGQGAFPVDQSQYVVFDKSSLAAIPVLYSEMSTRVSGLQTLGFENQGWIYHFNFANSEDAKKQNDFVISVAN